MTITISQLNASLRSLGQSIYYSSIPRTVLASIFSAGKVFQAAGQNMIGLGETLKRVPAINTDGDLAITILLTLNNIMVNTATRTTSIYNYFLLPNIYVVQTMPDLSEFFGLTGYVICLDEKNLYQFDASQNVPDKVNLDDKATGLLADLCQKITGEVSQASNNTDSNKILPEGKSRAVSPSTMPSSQSGSLLAHDIETQDTKMQGEVISAALTPEQWSQFAKIIDVTQLEADGKMGLTAWLAYYAFYSMCCLSTPFSAMSAYLSGVTFVEKFVPHLSEMGQVTFGSYIAVCAVVAYLNFNLPKMKQGVQAFCQSLDDGLKTGNFGIPVKAMSVTVLATFFGIVSGAGMAYLSMSKSLEKFPLTHDLSDDLKETLILAGVFTSIFTSVFAFAFSSYKLIKKICSTEAEPNALPFLTQYHLYALAIMLVDSVSNSLGSFIGTLMLIDKYLNFVSPIDAKLLFAVSILSLINNVVMNFSMGLVGSEQAIAYVNKYCCAKPATGVYQPPPVDSSGQVLPTIGTPGRIESGGFSRSASNESLDIFSPLMSNRGSDSGSSIHG